MVTLIGRTSNFIDELQIGYRNRFGREKEEGGKRMQENRSEKTEGIFPL